MNSNLRTESLYFYITYLLYRRYRNYDYKRKRRGALKHKKTNKLVVGMCDNK